MKKRVVHMKVLPGEPLDGTGKVCVHLIVQDELGPFTEPCVLHMEDAESDDGQQFKRLVSKPTRMRLACSPSRTVAPMTQGNVTTVTTRTDDPRAVTCLKCRATEYYTRAMELIATANGQKVG